MPATTRKGVWDLQQVRDQYLNGEWEKQFQLWVWGYNTSGQLGQNDVAYRSSPVQIPGTQWNTISLSYVGLMTKTDGTLWTWGNNAYGALGQNDVIYRSSPVQVPGTQWSTAVAGVYSTYSIKTDGTLWVCGYNASGGLGLNDRTYYSSPVQIPGTQWNIIKPGTYSDYGAVATKTDGTLWIWGTNANNQLGLNDTVPRSSPTQIPGTQWNNVGKGQRITFATKTDGTLWIWGLNSSGQLGQNDRVNYSSPRQIPGTQWNLADGGNSHTLATKTDGTLWAWGFNSSGQLGLNNVISYSSPVQIPGTQWALDANSINTLYISSAARKTDGTLWVWGQNAYGALGQNDTTTRSSPIQIPGTQWVAVSGDVYELAAIKSVVI